MKKTLCILCSLLFIFTITGCEKKAEPVKLNNLYTIDADVTIGEYSATVSLNRLGNGVWDIAFTKPENMNGMTATYENENIKISYKGLSFDMPVENIPFKAIVTNLTTTLDNVAFGNDVQFTKSEDRVFAKGKANGNSYKFTFDEKSGSLLELQIDDIELSAGFSNYKAMQ